MNRTLLAGSESETYKCCVIHVLHCEIYIRLPSSSFVMNRTQVSDVTDDCGGISGFAERGFTSSQLLNGVFVHFLSDSDPIWLQIHERKLSSSGL